jgi:4-hydroxybutyrate CoA-transferase
MDWRDEYKRKMVSPEEAVSVIKPGHRVHFAYGTEPLALGLALLSKAGELSEKGIKLLVPAPGRDFAWYDPGWENIFSVEIAHVLPLAHPMMREKRGDYVIGDLTWSVSPELRDPVDVLLIQLSPPDEHGLCSFGSSMWDKKEAVRSAKIVLAEANENLIRTYGSNFIHVSEIDYFVEHTPSGKMPGSTDMLGRKSAGPTEVEKNIAEHVASLIKDGDTLEIGVGGTAEWIPILGVLEGKNDLGWHSENTPRGIATLVKKGIINGKRKTLHKERAVATAVGGGTREEMEYINMNPIFEVYESKYVLDPRTIAANDNIDCINSALAVDLTGQVSAESIGPVMLSGTGGQLAFAIGASIAKEGKYVVTMRSTAMGGTVSRIAPQLEPGTVVTVPRVLADYVVTEYGIAHIKGKTQRQRAQELINIAHPDFRSELKKEAERLYWP